MRAVGLVAAGIVALALIGSIIWDMARKDKAAQVVPEPVNPDPFAGGFPVPPLDAPHYHGVAATNVPVTKKEVESGIH